VVRSHSPSLDEDGYDSSVRIGRVSGTKDTPVAESLATNGGVRIRNRESRRETGLCPA
jgi:hypothetical protein